jgi:hypothetical protein
MLRSPAKAASRACFLIRWRGAGVMYCLSSSPAAPLQHSSAHREPPCRWHHRTAHICCLAIIFCILLHLLHLPSYEAGVTFGWLSRPACIME